MSYTLDLCDPVTKECLSVDTPHHISGANVAVGGTNALTLDVTMNYTGVISPKFDEALKKNGYEPKDGERWHDWLENKTGAESIPVLKDTIANLGDNVHEDYWVATEGNAKRALCGLLAFAQMRPDGIWQKY